MHTIWTRAHTVTVQAVTYLFYCTVACAISSVFFTATPIVNSVELVQVKAFVPSGPNQVFADRALLEFNLDADLRPLFNWNVQLVFVYVCAEFQTPRNAVNKVVVWDDILTTKEAGLLKLRNQLAEYPLADQHKELKGKDVTLKLYWEVMPLAGMLVQSQLGAARFSMPDAYVALKRD